jgi:hypothetical protein
MDPVASADKPAPAPPMPPGPPARRSNGFAIASLVCGVLAVFLFLTIVLPVILGVLAAIFGAVGISNANAGAGQKGFAIAGIVCGIVGIVAMIVFVSIFATATVEIIHSYTPSFSPMP